MACQYCKKQTPLLTFNGYSVLIVGTRLVAQSQAQADLGKRLKIDGKPAPVYASAWENIKRCPMCGDELTPPESRDK